LIVRPKYLVAGAALSAALALVAQPNLAGSQSPSSPAVVDSAAFLPIQIPAIATGRQITVRPLDAAHESAGRVDAAAIFSQPAREPERVVGRPSVDQPAAPGGSALKPPRYQLTGMATFYHHGTTAMRLPRGTTVIICGAGGCIERTIGDYGPTAGTERIADLYVEDFFSICGCPSWSGTTKVTVSVY
jgi:hypothetical protein